MPAAPARRVPLLRRALRPSVAVLAPLVVVLAVLPWRADVPGSAAALVMVVVIVAVASRGDRTAGLLAAASAAAWFDLFLTRPYGSFSISAREDVETAVLLLVVGAAVTEIAVRSRHHRAVAALDTAYLATIARVADLAGGGGGSHATTATVRDALRDVLGVQDVRFERGRAGGMPRLDADGRLGIDDGWWPVEQIGLPPMEFEIVAERGGVGYGRFVVHASPGTHPNETALLVAKVLADQAATALAQEGRRHSTA